jgi:CoA:oxalate CoA-transferase
MPTQKPPLDGVTVVDFTTFLSGPFATQILADLGARIIKIEAPTGDNSRSIPPHYVDGESAYFLGTNRGKESVALNLKDERGRDIARTIIRGCDVVIENFRPGVASRLGLDAVTIRNEQPPLVWASISGFGQYGQTRDDPAYDLIVQALSGAMSLTGEPDGEPVRMGIPSGDLTASLFANIAIITALFEREKSGEGRTIDVSMLDGQLSMLAYQATYSLLTGVAPKGQGSGHDSIPTYRSFRAGDGRTFVVTAITDRMWRELADMVDRRDLLSDSRFTTPDLRLANKTELWPILVQAMTARPAAEWVEELMSRGVPAALIKTVPEALQDAEKNGRDMILTLTGSTGQQLRVVDTPIRFSGQSTTNATYPPLLGEHTYKILNEFTRFSDDEISNLLNSGVVSVPESRAALR